MGIARFLTVVAILWVSFAGIATAETGPWSQPPIPYAEHLDQLREPSFTAQTNVVPSFRPAPTPTHHTWEHGTRLADPNVLWISACLGFGCLLLLFRKKLATDDCIRLASVAGLVSSLHLLFSTVLAWFYLPVGNSLISCGIAELVPCELPPASAWSTWQMARDISLWTGQSLLLRCVIFLSFIWMLPSFIALLVSPRNTIALWFSMVGGMLAGLIAVSVFMFVAVTPAWLPLQTTVAGPLATISAVGVFCSVALIARAFCQTQTPSLPVAIVRRCKL